MRKLSYSIKTELDEILDADVVVVGAGPAGLGAAVTAGRRGAKTVIVERLGYPGGMATAGEVHPFMGNHKTSLDPAKYLKEDVCFDRPVYLDWVNAARAYLPGEDAVGEAVAPRERFVDKHAAALGAEDLLLDAGVVPLYHHHLFDVVARNRMIENVVLFSKSGLTAVKGKMFVDCSGDADLAMKAGCECESGSRDGRLQPMTLSFKLENVDLQAIGATVMERRQALSTIYAAAKRAGEVDCPRADILVFDCFEDDALHFNTTRVEGVDGTCGVDLAKAEIEGRRQMRQIIDLLRRRAPGCAAARLRSIGSTIGVRETRRVMGRAYLRREDFGNRSKFPDAVARCMYPIDIHIPGHSDAAPPMPRGEWYEIPYGCVVARDMDNLLLGGRLLSSDHAINGSLRVMPPACSTGQAAGMAASMSVENDCSPGDLDGLEVRRELIAFGAFL